MHYRQLGISDLNVSQICLGTMNFGEQVSEVDAHEQMNYAVEQGINFFDTAEMYPIPPHKQSQGRTETYIGNWLKKTGKRNELIIASKVIGPTDLTYVRDGKEPHHDRKNIRKAIEGSLRRLQTDYIDLYQLHWPDRKTNFFNKRGYKHDPDSQHIPLEETLSVMAELIKEGKIRCVGVSNETAWGVMEYFRLHREKGLPRVQSIQNPYSLIMREYETALAEISIREKLSLLVYSPLSFGVLTGKYLGGKRPTDSRFAYAKGRSEPRYNPPHAQTAIEAYVKLARKYNLDPAQMALAFVDSREFVTSTIIGATSIEQLKTDIASIYVPLPYALLNEIEQIHLAMPNPIT